MICSKIPCFVDRDRTLRIKIIDTCGMTCTFCHNESIPVTVDNRKREVGNWVTHDASGRASIYAKEK
jgi:molybdenum cofactor biosynthesis enzyme MoaA